ncbi:hypothetical protein GCM10023235_17630 [Kitasatospora terrestris]|uniref:Uncharacterized protein n=1 Tax=Kitasatospora terrestris TaxID=258051 RepID=A0ABP9DLC4_9ACTN
MQLTTWGSVARAVPVLMKSSSHKGADTAGPTGVMPVTSDSLGRATASPTLLRAHVNPATRGRRREHVRLRAWGRRGARGIARGVQVHVHHGPLRSLQMQEWIHVQSRDWHMHGPDARASWGV